MTTNGDTERPAPENQGDRSPLAFGAIVLGRTVGVVLFGAALGAGYSVATRVAAPPPSLQFASLSAEHDSGGDASAHAIRPNTRAPAEMAALPDQAAPTKTVVREALKPSGPIAIRDVSMRSITLAPAEATPQMAFRSIATLSASSPRLEAEVRGLKGAAASPDDAEIPPEKGARFTGKVDAVAAVWGFLAVGLVGTTAPRPAALGRSADRRFNTAFRSRQPAAEEVEDSRFLVDKSGGGRNRMIGLATLRD